MNRYRILSGIGFLGMVAAILGLIATHSILARNPILIAVQVLAVLLMLWARLTFGLRSFHASANPTAGSLVTSGPYRFLRHPIYGAVLLFIFSAVASNISIPNAGLALLGTLGALIRIFLEESLLRREYPEYAAYSKRVNRLIPFVF